MDKYGVDVTGRRTQRRHSAEFKQTVVSECVGLGVSIAKVAVNHGLDTNLQRSWVIKAEHARE